MKVAIYCRLSKEDVDKKDESESIKNQKIMLTTYAMQNDWEIANYYIDDDFKGSDRNRPQFNEMIKDAALKKFEIVLCKSQARFARDLELIEKYLHGKFPEWGIRFISVVDRADTLDKGNKKSRQIIGLKDEWYLEDLSDDIRRVLNNKRENGVYIGSWALYGYLKDPEKKGHLIVDPEAAEVVKEIYRLYIEGDGIQKIARTLNDKGVDNPYMHKKKRGISFNEGRMTPKAVYWNVGAVYSILTNQTYAGDLVQGRFQKLNFKSKKLIRMPKESWYITNNSHEGIVSKELFDKAQEIRMGKGRAIKDGTRHIFHHKVFCNECEQVLSMGRYPKNPKIKTKETEYVRYLKCSSRTISMASCIGASITLPILEKYILAEINNLANTYFDEDEVMNQANFENQVKENHEKLQRNIKTLQRRITDNELALKNLYMDKVKGLINEEEFISLKMEVSKDKQRYQHELEKTEVEAQKLQKQNERESSRKDIISKYRKIEGLTRQIVEELIDKIYVGHKNKETGERVIKIVWAI